MRFLTGIMVVVCLAAPLTGCKGRRGLSRMEGVDAGPAADSGPGTDSGPGVDSGPGFDSGPPVDCTSAADCDDGMACTRDTCSGGTCSNVDDDALCSAGEMCSAGTCVSGCSESPCRIVAPQCGCAGGETCILDNASGDRFCGAAGSTSAGGECSDSADCRASMVCVGFGVLQCHRACASDSDCPGGGSLCSIEVGDVSPPVKVCNPVCNPVGGAGCSSGSKCVIGQESSGAMRFYTACAGPVGTGTQGASCTTEGNCGPGYFCSTASSTCVKYCRPGFSSDCPSGFTCATDGSVTINGVEYSVCM